MQDEDGVGHQMSLGEQLQTIGGNRLFLALSNFTSNRDHRTDRTFLSEMDCL